MLKEAGKYTLSYVIEDVDTTQIPRVYNIGVNEYSFKDTLALTSIYSCLEPTSHPNFIGYCCCEEKCEGNQIEYYANGNKRIEGYFKVGKPIGELKFYHPNGKFYQVEKYSKRGRLRKRIFYDEDGQVDAVKTF